MKVIVITSINFRTTYYSPLASDLALYSLHHYLIINRVLLMSDRVAENYDVIVLEKTTTKNIFYLSSTIHTTNQPRGK